MGKIWDKISYRLAKINQFISKPRMLSYKRNFQKEKAIGLRIGNTTFIDSPKNLFLEDLVYIGHHNFIEASNTIKIGKGCQITSFVSMTTHSSHQSIRLYGAHYAKISEHVGYEKGPIEIGAFSFVGPFTVIMPSTKIGKGCVITAHSYVKGEFPDYAIISGNPAKIIGDTREKDTVYLESHPDLKKFYMSEQ
jgi:acetyltransferase-like isoleucine patch superfamily enzyme